MRKLSIGCGLIACLFIALLGGDASAEQGANDKIQAAAKKLFQGLASGNLGQVKEVTVKRYAGKLTDDKLGVAPTGAKVKAAFDGNVTIVRSGPDDAVVEAKLFSPESADTPPGEVNRVRVYLVEKKGEWLAAAADKKEAQDDAGTGGWYHAGSFTFCPNKGMVFVPNHFSSEEKCPAVAICR